MVDFFGSNWTEDSLPILRDCLFFSSSLQDWSSLVVSIFLNSSSRKDGLLKLFFVLLVVEAVWEECPLPDTAPLNLMLFVFYLFAVLLEDCFLRFPVAAGSALVYFIVLPVSYCTGYWTICYCWIDCCICCWEEDSCDPERCCC